jgi:capsular exopolysaccharide synthesis family protein
VEAAEVQVESLRKQFGLEASDQGTLSSQEMVEINTQLVMARTARAEAEVRLRRVETLLRSPDGATSASEVLDSPLIQRLREQEAEIQRRVAELSSELGERHPQMIKLRAEAQDLQVSIRAEVRKIVSGLRNEVSVARAREQSLQLSLNASRERVALDNEDEIRLRAAEREAESSRSLLATLLSRQKATMSQQDIASQAADARVVAAADPPVKPSIPNVPVVLGLTLLASTLLGLLTILVLEMLDSGFRSGEQIEQQTGAAALGFIPMAVRSAPDQRLVDYLTARPTSAYSEAIRTLAWSIGLDSKDRPPKTVLITSAQPGEGKTSIASSLSWVQSRSDQRVVIIDADLRQPAVHDAFFVPKEPGLMDVLAGRKSVDEVLQRPNEQGPFILPAGTTMPNVTGMLGSRRMDELLADLRNRFDLVILDSPPVLAAADARILAQKADATVMVVHWAKTRRESVRLALRQLTGTAGVRLVGAVLSQVDARKHAQYSYGDSGAYAGALEKYYVG